MAGNGENIATSEHGGKYGRHRKRCLYRVSSCIVMTPRSAGHAMSAGIAGASVKEGRFWRRKEKNVPTYERKAPIIGRKRRSLSKKNTS